MRVFGADYRGLSRGDRLIGEFFWPLLFVVGAAAAGDVAIGFWATTLSFALFPQYFFFRVMPAFAVLAAAGFARRRSLPRAWFFAGTLLPIAFLTAVEFSFFSAVAAFAAIAVSEGRRTRNLTAFIGGAAITSSAVGVGFAILGILSPFLRTSFVYLPQLAPAYALGFPSLSSRFENPVFPDAFALLTDPSAFYFWCLLLAIVGFAVILAGLRNLDERGRSLLPFIVWFLASTLSIFERQHYGYALFVAPIAIVLAARWSWNAH
jgi:hypothetical protein